MTFLAIFNSPLLELFPTDVGKDMLMKRTYKKEKEFLNQTNATDSFILQA